MLTWGIDQGHVVPDAQPRLLRQSGGHPLGLPVQLDAGRCACDRALGSGEGVSTGPAEPAPRPARPRGAAHLGVQQQKQGVVGGGVGPPLQHVRQEQELAEARGSAPPRLPPPRRHAPHPLPPRGDAPLTRPALGPHLPRLVAVLQVSQLPPRGLCDPLPGDQIPKDHGGRADLWEAVGLCEGLGVRPTPARAPFGPACGCLPFTAVTHD